MNKKISVIIPLYNKEDSIRATIKSVIEQDYAVDEIIVIDDGSEDDSYNQLMKIDDSRIKIHLQENSGVSAARNKGIKLAENDYIAFLDADDEWMPNYISEIVKLIESFPDAGIYSTSYTMTNEQCSTSNYIFGLVDYFEMYINGKRPGYTSSFVFDRSKINDVAIFPENISMGEDIFAWTNIINSGATLAHSSKKLVMYHTDVENSLMKVGRAKPYPVVLERKESFINISSNSFSKFLEHFEIDYIKSNILFGSKKNVIIYILLKRKFKYIQYLMISLLPRKLLKFFLVKNRLSGVKKIHRGYK